MHVPSCIPVNPMDWEGKPTEAPTEGTRGQGLFQISAGSRCRRRRPAAAGNPQGRADPRRRASLLVVGVPLRRYVFLLAPRPRLAGARRRRAGMLPARRARVSVRRGPAEI